MVFAYTCDGFIDRLIDGLEYDALKHAALGCVSIVCALINSNAQAFVLSSGTSYSSVCSLTPRKNEHTKWNLVEFSAFLMRSAVSVIAPFVASHSNVIDTSEETFGSLIRISYYRFSWISLDVPWIWLNCCQFCLLLIFKGTHAPFNSYSYHRIFSGIVNKDKVWFCFLFVHIHNRCA